ncbi:DUF1178 family protein [Rhodobacteraceae bacterium KMM 6894]|nr:DUF1178 family protein [Rhodobacteraceae bacterium KMM 6894]
MIKFTLKCDKDHRFDSWFQSADAYDKLARAGMVSCAVCGSVDVEKSMMAPSVQASRSKKSTAPPAPSDITPPASTGGALSAPASPAEQALAQLRRKVEENSEYVGMNFARAARDIHDGAAPERAIYGEARLEDARQLIEDGIPVAPLPFRPSRKSN